MNAKVKRLWLKALRGGRFQQEQSALRVITDEDQSVSGYCCLGVLCEVFHRVTGKGKWMANTFIVDGTSSMSQLPDPVRKWAEIDKRDPLLGRTKTAIGLNDHGKTFAFIADRIEKYL